MNVTTRLQVLHPRSVWRISRASRRETTNVFLSIERDGITGYAEAPANAYYKEEPADIAARLDGMAGFLKGCAVDSPNDIAVIWDEAWAVLAPSRAAQCALDVALWDWLAKRKGMTVTELALGQKPRPVVSFATLGISEPEELEAKLAEIAGFPRVKVKSDASGDLSMAARVRAAVPEAMIAVDANSAWGEVDMARTAPELASLWIDFVEQPFPPARDGEMEELCMRLPAPVMADESCVTVEDVERMPGRFAGFNIKLVKCGGITPALKMARRGKQLGLRTMVGCMLESSLLIAAGCVVGQVTDYADLDGAWLLGDDPVEGWRFECGVLEPGTGAGLGVRMNYEV